MQENILVIHGSFGSPNSNWFPWLYNKLSKANKNVLIPSFPIGLDFQNYNNWSKVLAAYKNCGLLNEKTIIIAHSIGPIFILKYLLLNKLKVQKLIFVSGFNNYLGLSSDYDQVNSSFFLDNLEAAKTCSNEIICIYSKNDPYLPVEKLQEFSATVATTEIVIPEGGHLNNESGYTKFEEILDFI